jgi:hypothetical protein
MHASFWLTFLNFYLTLHTKQSGSRSVQENVETTVNTQLAISSKERQYFDMAYNLTSTAGNSKYGNL